MCFLLLQYRVHEAYPVVLLANRDEAYARAFDAPRRLDEPATVVAPRDRIAGGTWLGRRDGGLVAAITNRGFEELEGVRSRGQVVLDALRHGSASEARAWLMEHLATEPYAGFQLLVADAASAFILVHDASLEARAPTSDDVLDLDPGVHVLSNLHAPGEVPVPERARFDPTIDLAGHLRRLAGLASDDTTVLPRDHRILKRGRTRGTVCSALLATRRGGGGAFWFAGGAPDVAPFLRVRSPLL